MQTKEVNERSPLRVLEKSIHGGLGRGNLGAVVARHGVGKTAFLVGVALDDLMRGRKVLHVGLDQTVRNIIGHYDEVFNELAHERKLEDVWQVRLDVERNRQVHAFLDGSFSMQKMRDTLHFLRSYADFVPSAIVVEGFDFESAGESEFADLRAIAKGCDAEVWMSATTTRDAARNDAGIPAPLVGHAAHLDVVLGMQHHGSAVQLSVLKDHENAAAGEIQVALDPTTMLLVKEAG